MGYRIGVMMKALGRRLLARSRDDAGQTVLLVAAIILGAALTAAALFVNLDAGKRMIARLKAGNARQATAVPALLAYYLQHSTGANGSGGTLPCPDTSATPTGTAAASCDGSSAAAANAGALPWVTLGISRDQAVDTYGNYYTYVVSNASRTMCRQITNSYSSAASLTGTLDSTSASIDVKKVSGASTSSTGLKVPFALIGHGANGLGARSSNNVTKGTATSVGEMANADPQAGGGILTTAVVSGPYTGSQGDDTAFDDQVYVPTISSLEKICLSLTGASAVNAALSENFSSGAFDATKVDTAQSDATVVQAQQTISGASTATTNYVARFVGAQAFVTNAVNYVFDPRVQPVHAEALWTPDATEATCSSGRAGMSIATRVTPADRGALSDIYDAGGKHGVTFRFYTNTAGNIDGTAVGVDNNVSILTDTGQLAGAVSATTYKLICNKTYLIEAYDDGNHVWARITQTDDGANTAYAQGTTATDLDGDKRVAFIGGITTTNYVDDIVIGPAMLSVESNGTSGYITAGSQVIAGAMASSTVASATFEAMVRLRKLGSTGVIMSQWDPGTTAANNSFRVYVDATGHVTVNLSGNVTETHSFGTLSLNEWTTVSVVYSVGSVSLYLDGVLSGTSTSTITPGIVVGTQNFIVGADAAGTADWFFGDIADVRVWSGARTAADIASTYRTRLAYTGQVTDSGTLLLNWKLDADPYTTAPVSIADTAAYSTGTSSSTVAAAGTLTGAHYVASLAQHIRPFADTVCAAGAIAGIYQCDYRAKSAASFAGVATTTPVVPTNLQSIYAKVWGGGGGGYFNTSTTASAGGGGGYSGGKIYALDGLATPTVLPGHALTIAVGGIGIGSTTPLSGAGGGGAAAVSFGTTVIMAAGGGGGGSFSNSTLVGCGALTNLNTTAQCGLGGGGGGYSANPLRGPDGVGTPLCGGQSGTVTPGSTATNPINNLCYGGGAVPSVALPATGGGGTGFAGGVSVIGTSGGSGGAGYTSTNSSAGMPGTQAPGAAGAGGGGGGVYSVNASFVPTGGGAGAGGYGRLNYDTVQIGGTPTTGDTITLQFTNASVFAVNPYTFTYSVGASDTDAIAIAQHMVTAINVDATLSSANVGIVAAFNGAASDTFWLLQQNETSGTTLVGAVPGTVTVAPANATMSGGVDFDILGGIVGVPATADITFNGNLRNGDVISITVSGGVTVTNAVVNHTVNTLTDTSIPVLATNLASELNTALAAHLGYSAAYVSGGTIRISYSTLGLGILGLLGNGTTVATTVPSPPTETISAGASFTSAGTLSGFGGGGGGGYSQASTQPTNVINAVGDAGPVTLIGTPGNSYGTNTVTVTTPGTVLAGDTVSLIFNGTGLANRTVTFTSTAGGDTPTEIATALVLAINTDTGAGSLQTANISADNLVSGVAGSVITLRQRGSDNLATQITFAVSNVARETVALSPFRDNIGRFTGYDYYYSPPYLSTGTSSSPAVGGTAGGNGRAAAVVLSW